MQDSAILFERDLETCQDCKHLPASITLERWRYEKPSVLFRTHIDWKRDQVNVLFIAESPPGTSSGYFYDPQPKKGYKQTLRNELFRLLKIEANDVAAGLREFKEKGYFLSDAVKCRCYKGERPQVPMPLVRNCGARWIEREIFVLNPGKICTLGKAALKALARVAGYEGLASHDAGADCGSITSNTARPVLIWVFPSKRTSQYSKGKDDLFHKFVSN